jgi:cell wall-associated NlpC family hydrolase
VRVPVLVLAVTLAAGAFGTAAATVRSPTTNLASVSVTSRSGPLSSKAPGPRARAGRVAPALESPERKGTSPGTPPGGRPQPSPQTSTPSQPQPQPAPPPPSEPRCRPAPAGTLRDGSDRLEFAALCRDSVEQAATPQAGEAVRFVLSNLGAPYSLPRRNEQGWYDCSSYVARAYQAAGVPIAPPGVNAPTTWVLLAMQGTQTTAVQYTDARPGDLIFPEPGHVAMVLADGFMAHTNRTGDVSHVSRLYPRNMTYLVLRINP